MNNSLEHIDNKSREMLAKTKSAILSVEPDAEVFLFGSRARGDYNKDSDWDLLVLISGESDYQRDRTIIHKVFDIELAYHQIFNIIIHIQEYWNNDRFYHVTPFYKNVSKDKVAI